MVHDPNNGVSRLSPGSWYTLSFWAKGGSYFPLINQTSSDYGFAKKGLYLQAGHKYEISVNGNIDQAAKNEGKKLEVKVYNQSQSEQKSLFITTVNICIATMEFTPKETGIYYLESYMSDSNRPSTGKVTLNYYKVIDCGLSTYIYPSAVDTAAKIYVDGVEQTPGSDLCINWKLDSTWQRHTVSFKTKSLLSYSEAQAVLFRLLPAVSPEFERYVNICMPKLEVGMMATGFIDTRSDSKGSTGSVLRGPQLWNTCINGYRFEAGGEGDEWKDAVFYNGNTYSCIKTHVKTADNYPGSAADLNNHYWKLGQSIELLIAHIILTQYQMVENLGVRTIEMKDKDGNVVFRAKDGDLICKGGIFQNVSVSGDVSVGRLRYKENTVTDGTSVINGSFIRGWGTYVLPHLKDGESMRIVAFNPIITRSTLPTVLKGEQTKDVFMPASMDISLARETTIEFYGWCELIGTNQNGNTIWVYNNVENNQKLE